MSTSMQPLQPVTMPLHGVRLIEASAGTGKTWIIAALYVRAVLGHDMPQPLLPPQLLVVTFTEAATQELRERIRARLVEAARAFRASASDEPFLAELIATYPVDAHASCARRLELAAQWMDEAAIFTIHGWSQRMLTQHAFGSGHAFALTLEPDESELLADCVRDYWRQTFYPLPPRQAEMVLEEWRSPDDLLRALKPLFYGGEVTLRVAGEVLADATDPRALMASRGAWQAEHDRLLAEAAEAWRSDIDRIEALLTEASTTKVLNNTRYRPDRMPGYLAPVRRWAFGGEAIEEALQRFTATRLADAAGKGKQRPEHPAFAALDAWQAWNEHKVDIRHALLVDALARVRERFAAQKRRRAQIGFDDLLHRLDAALRSDAGDALAETIRRQFPLALIDEFQDTDPVQYRIFSRIYAGVPDVGLLLIGDPKQAIYAFRGADIHTYLSARAQALAPHYSLDTNYRSSHAMIEAVNAVFLHGERHPHGAFHFPDRGLPFAAVSAKGRAERFVVARESQPALRLWLLDDERPVGVRHYREQMADACASEIVRLLEGATRGDTGFAEAEGRIVPLRPADVAVLVRSRSEAAQVRASLAARQVRSVFLSDRDSVWESAEAEDVLAWLRAAAAPASDTAMRAALATRTLDLGYIELEQLNVDEAHWERRGEEFLALRQVWQRAGVLAMLHALLHRFDLPARLLLRAGGERALTNVLHLAELLQHAASMLDGEQALIRHVAERIADTASHHGDDQLVRLESDDDVVKVITIHKSKGLEYPIVFLPFVCASGGPHPGQTAYRYHDGTGSQLELVSKSKGGAASEQAKDAADLAALQEDLRLLYVAMTRARHACYVGVAPVCHGTSRTPQVHRSAFGHLLSGGEEIGNGRIAGLLHELAQATPSIRVEYMPPPDERRFVAPDRPEAARPAREATARRADPWRIASYSGLRYADEVSAPETATDDVIVEYATEPVVAAPTVAGIHAFERGAEAGTFLHDLLEWIAEEGFATVARDSARLRDTVARRCERRGWSTFIDLLTDWLSMLLRTPLALPDGGQLALASLDDPSRYRAELEFLFASRGVDTLALDRIVREHTLDGEARPTLAADIINGMLKGFIDLIVEHEGRWYVVDYKSNWLGVDAQAYTTAAMRRSILEARYELQYALYLLALHRQLRARLGDAYDYDTHIGGAVYLYLRGVDGHGHGVHVERPPRAMIEAMDRLFEGASA
ncbi:exodeoxyribonuclease V subunit beta [Luteibacter sp. UNCMF366Tsu5.1]|uniref:exodeoxyribonuclease V subunit beta n=1 Tax=Luteibacter sp. UNCMF366Tsu5.1 TaxID=1502758 RepID=UPI000908B514|nr:exodeoxyribonuclease V subunit beta [Luteibacter sp. UNCMF366Tsu5.1]SFW62173.1 DNA helicase/exodeoxyribonuclease V, beta subunit [Luteibacter sp. UNCMF366Tsu5.1]